MVAVLKTNPESTLKWWSKHWRAILGISLFVVVGVLFWYVSQTEKATSMPVGNAAGLLALIAAAAVCIERVIEGIWTVVSQLTNAWWPINEIADQIKKLEDDLNLQLEGVYTSVEGVIKASGGTADEINRELAELPAQLKEMRTRIKELQGLAKDNQQVSLIAATAQQHIGLLERKYPDVKAHAEVANQAIAGLTDFVASFKDNPVRRMFSLFIGAILGLSVAWMMQLDVFLAVFGTTPQPKLWPYLGVALTGLLIGLGSGPTHDVVSVLQEVKKLRASQNQPGPSTEAVTPGTEEEGGGKGRSVGGLGTVRRFR